MKRALQFVFSREIMAAIWVRAFGGWWAEHARQRLGKVAGERSANTQGSAEK